MNDSAPSQKLEQLISDLKLPGDTHAALLATKLIDALSLACAGQGGVYHLASFLTACGNIKWDALTFDLSAHLVADDVDSHATYLQALGVFLNVLAEDPDYATETTFNEILQSLAEPEEPKPAPEIFQPQMLARVFDSKVLSDDDLRKLDARFVLYRHVYATGKISHQLRGLAFVGENDQLSIVLESGEFVEVAKDYPHLATLNVRDGHVVPSTLLAYTYWLAKDLVDRKLISLPVFDAIETRQQFGAPTRVTEMVRRPVNELVGLHDAIDSPQDASNTAAEPGLVIPVQIGERVILLHAKPAETGMQMFASVFDEKTEQVLMRLDYPRTFSVRGVYLFPLVENPVFLTVL